MDIGKITFNTPNVSSGLPMPECRFPKKSAEEMLKKVLEYAYQGMEESDCNNYEAFQDGKYIAYEDMAAYLEMLIKEVRQDG